MNTIKSGNIELQLPGSWNELSAKQLLKICKLLQSGGKLLELRILMVLLGVKGWWNSKIRRIPNTHLTYLAYDATITGWVGSPAKLTSYPISSFRYKGKRYYGPFEDILNISIAEWVEAVMYFTAYVESMKTEQPDDTLLDKMIAVLYRPKRFWYALEKLNKDFEIDCRQVNNLYRFNHRVRRFEGLKPELKMAIFLQFEGAYNAYPENFPDAFGSSAGEADVNAWVNLLMAMSGDLFGDYEKTQKVDAFTFFTKVNLNIKQAKETEERMKKRK